MGNLFRGWPADKLAQIFIDDSEPDRAVCANSFHLGLEDLPMPICLRPFIARHKGIVIKSRAAGETTAGYSAFAGRLRGMVRTFAKRCFSSYAKLASFAISPSLDSWITAFAPELIYSNLESPYVISLVTRVSRKYGLNVAPHFMDDWIAASSRREDGILGRYVRWRARKQSLTILTKAKVRLAIGEKMALEYKRRYGYTFHPFMNCVDLDARPVVKVRADTQKCFRFGCVGALHLGRADSLRQIGFALGNLRKEGMDTEIVIYQNQKGRGVPRDLLSGTLIRLSSVEEDQLLGGETAQLDAFLHLDTFDPNQAAYFIYSLSAKIPWCLAAGLPVFAYGPPNIASIRYLTDQHCALVITEQSPEVLGSGLRRFIQDKDLRAQLGHKARNVAAMHHDSSAVKERFRCALDNALLAS